MVVVPVGVPVVVLVPVVVMVPVPVVVPVPVPVSVSVLVPQYVQLTDRVRVAVPDSVTVAGLIFHPTLDTVVYQRPSSMNTVAVPVEEAVPVIVWVK